MMYHGIQEYPAGMADTPYQPITPAEYERLTWLEKHHHHVRLRAEIARRIASARVVIAKTKAFIASTK